MMCIYNCLACMHDTQILQQKHHLFPFRHTSSLFSFRHLARRSHTYTVLPDRKYLSLSTNICTLGVFIIGAVIGAADTAAASAFGIRFVFVYRFRLAAKNWQLV